MAAEDVDTERKTVATYVPAYQKREWADHADRLGMSQSEFVRTMVQAGRHEFGVPEDPTKSDGAATEFSGGSSTQSGGDAVESRVRAALATEEYLSWDELLASLTDDIEGRLDDALQRLQSSNAVQYSGRHGGYTLNGGETE
jgi:hypothetical protein